MSWKDEFIAKYSEEAYKKGQQRRVGNGEKHIRKKRRNTIMSSVEKEGSTI